MGKNDDHIGQGAEDTSRTLDAVKPMYEIGSTIGCYKLLSVLGEGGFGMVYLAEQQRPIKRLVALKLIKPGMDTKQVIARFETERQALAMLDHPHIARVFDAGATEAGRPYFAMEYVKGIPITEYCDRYKLNTQERLRLFIPLCQAIQHAHHKGIIHRDIKPSNALVTLHDEKPIPKIIDFGVAKALNQRLTERTLFTEQGQFIGTPEYMSPEQAELTGLDVDTRTDIYSLGVLLYELLTGCTPFDAQDLRSKGYAEMQRIICEQDPVKPSTKLTTLGGRLQDIAKHRSATADQLRKSVRGDLDWIVMKTLEKDRARRYGTAQALAEDIERHLNHQPVSAGSPGILYRSRKFVRRHRTQAVVGCFLLAVVILSAAIIGQYQQARRSLQTVQRESEARQEALALENARSSLSTAQADYASGRYAEVLKALNVLVDNKHVGSQARLLRARMALDQPDANVPIIDELQALLNEPNDIACQAHLLLAKIYLESRADDDKTARELERKATEHLQKAESLGSDSADACFNRALLSDTPTERMELLNKALAINPGHVDSRRVRALAHYASRNYDEMEIDASVITAVAKNNPEGYALRAIAVREKAQLRGQKELLSRAVAEHTRAIELAPSQSRFYDERRETYMRMDEFEKALADARECIRLSPAEGAYHFSAFCSLTALGRYAEAQREYETILAQSGSSTGEDQFRMWAAVYALDIVDRHSQWHPADREPEGAAFTIIRQTLEAHQNLAKKARCVVRDGAVATWSPAGDELAYSRGTLGYMAIEVLNLKTGTTRLLCYSGFDPAWSPDGRCIAFVRHRRTVRLQDLADGKKMYVPEQKDREVWIVNANGTGKPRMLARGGFPSWSRDSKRLYYYSPEEDGYLCSISIEGNSARPTRVIRTSSPYPVVSPDEKYVVWQIASSSIWNVVELVDLSSGKVVARWIGYFPNWSPDSKSLVFSRYDILGRENGVWVCDLEKGKAARVVDDWTCFRCSWAPHAGQIALSVYGQFPRTGEYIYSGMWGSIWIGPLDYSIFGADSSVLIQDWPRDESDARSLGQMVQRYGGMERTAEAEQLCRRLIEVLQQAVASGDRNSLQPVKQLADVYLWFGRYDDAEQLYLQARDKQLANSGAKAKGFLDLTEELVRFYLDVLNRVDKAEQLGLELSTTRREVLGADNPRAIRTLVLLARIYERQKRYREAERLYIEILNIKPGEDTQESAPEVYQSVLAPSAVAPLSYALDEASLVLRLLEDQNAGTARDKLWTTCAHYLLARLYATCPMAELHNVTKAIEHGTSACELSGWVEPICLDALAAAWAEAGRFDLAVRRQKEAIERLSGDKALMRTIFVNRLTMYERGLAKSPKGLVARWEFEQSKDGTVPDTSGNNLHGRLVGDAKVYADPDRGNVLRLDGEGDWVDCGADAKFDITDEITISVWIKVAKFDKAWQAVIAKGNSTWRLQRDQTTEALEFACSGVQATTGTNYYGNLAGHANVNDGKWHHVAGVYDGRRLSLYIDGELDAFTPALAFTRINTSTDHVLIGMNAGTQPPPEWNGLIDDLRIYSYALPPEDIKVLHEGKEPAQNKGSIR
jgi:serine/threonine protein kinase